MREYSLKVYDISAKGMGRIPDRIVLNTFQLPRKPNSIAAKDTSLTGDNYCHLGQMILPQTQLAAGHRLMNDGMNSDRVKSVVSTSGSGRDYIKTVERKSRKVVQWCRGSGKNAESSKVDLFHKPSKPRLDLSVFSDSLY